MTIFEQLDRAIVVVVFEERPGPGKLETLTRTVCVVLEKGPDGYDMAGVSRAHKGTTEIIIQPWMLFMDQLNRAEWDAEAHAWKMPLGDPGTPGGSGGTPEEHHWIMPLEGHHFLVGE